MNDDETLYFRVSVDPAFDNNASQDLVVKVFSEGDNQGDPDLFISKVSLHVLTFCIEKQEAKQGIQQ